MNYAGYDFIRPPGPRPPYKPPRAELPESQSEGYGSGNLTARVAWAVEVEPAHLGAHLETYTKLLPTIETLRLCHRFGKGPDAQVCRLPVELLSSIEGFVVRECRAKARNEWCADLECNTDSCDALSHVGDSEWTTLYKRGQEKAKALQRHNCDESCVADFGYCPMTMEEMEGFVEQEIEDGPSTPAARDHHTFKRRWTARIYSSRCS